MNKITPFTGSEPTTLTSALLAPNSGIVVDPTSVQLQAAGSSINFYDGGLQGIGAGLLLTSGITPGTSNTSTSFGDDNLLPGNAALDAVVNTVFQTQSFNATTLTFSFTVADPAATSVSFDLVFGTEEYPEWVDAFVDVAVVLVNGVNVALFNHNAQNPLSVISPNLAAGYFVDNAAGTLATEYDGVSALLKFVAPIHAGVNTITIGIADTGDGILDSGVFVSNLSAGTIPGSGVVSVTPGTSSDDTITGSNQAEYINLQAGNDIAYAGGGDDIVVAGAGDDMVYAGSGNDEVKGDAGNDIIDGGAGTDTAVYAGLKSDYTISFNGANGSYTISDHKAGPASEGTDYLSGIEVAKFADGSWTLGATGVVTPLSSTPVDTNANHPGTLVLGGIAGQGQTLTATLSDVDGLPASGVNLNWYADGISLGVSGDSYLLSAADVGKNITVEASYTDLAGNAETLGSNAKSVSAPGNGDFAISMLMMSAPKGSSTMNPLTTLVQNAITLGVSPNEAAQIVKSVLGVDPKISLQHYDAYASVLANPADKAAMAVEKVAVQVAVLTSLGSDETGMELTQAILLASSNNSKLNLKDKVVIGNLLGLDPTSALVKEIWDRNDTISSAKTLTAIDKIWVDMQSGLSVNLSDSVATLSVHLNQAPTGFATATLSDGVQDLAYTVSSADLLAGFSDPDGDPLTIENLIADHGTVASSSDGFTITPDAGYFGPIELSYAVVDVLGGTAAASQLFAVVSTNPPTVIIPSEPLPPVAAPDGFTTAEDTVLVLSAADLLANDVNPNNPSTVDASDGLSVLSVGSSSGAIGGSVSLQADGSIMFVPDANFSGLASFDYSITDSLGNTATSTVEVTVDPVNDAPTTSNVALTPIAEDSGIRIITSAELLTNVADLDSASFTVMDLAVVAGAGSLSQNLDGNWTYIPAENDHGTINLSYTILDDGGLSVAGTATLEITPVNDAPVGADDKASTPYQTPVSVDVLANDSDVDNLAPAAAHAGLSIAPLSLAVNASQGTASVANGQLLFTPAPGFSGVADVTYSATDGQLQSDLAHVLITVGAAPLPPAPPVTTPVTPPAGSGVILGTSGKDVLIGTSADNVLDGGKGADIMAGGQGNDTYKVDNEGDVVKELSNQGTDTVISSVDYHLTDNVENLTLVGTGNLQGEGNGLGNVLTGNAANNELSGDDGNDVLIGGLGRDWLSGGSGADIFKFLTLADSTVGKNRDVIEDFKSGQDKIDLSALDAIVGVEGDQAFSFIGAASFSHQAGQLRYDSNSHVLAGDINGDGIADFEIALLGITKLVSSDFVL